MSGRIKFFQLDLFISEVEIFRRPLSNQFVLINLPACLQNRRKDVQEKLARADALLEKPILGKVSIAGQPDIEI